MNITVFGANGKVGSKIVARLLADGHSVKAFIHGESRLETDPKLSLVTGDIHSSRDVETALAGADAAVSALGSWGTKSKDILTTGMQNIIPAMKAKGIKRIISLTGAGAYAPDDKPDLLAKLNHSLLGLTAPKILHDGEEHIKLLAKSKLDWTVLRSPIMKQDGKRGYQINNHVPSPWATINRDDVVEAMVDLLKADQYSKTSPFILRQD